MSSPHTVDVPAAIALITAVHSYAAGEVKAQETGEPYDGRVRLELHLGDPLIVRTVGQLQAVVRTVETENLDGGAGGLTAGACLEWYAASGEVFVRRILRGHSHADAAAYIADELGAASTPGLNFCADAGDGPLGGDYVTTFDALVRATFVPTSLPGKNERVEGRIPSFSRAPGALWAVEVECGLRSFASVICHVGALLANHASLNGAVAVYAAEGPEDAKYATLVQIERGRRGLEVTHLLDFGVDQSHPNLLAQVETALLLPRPAPGQLPDVRANGAGVAFPLACLWTRVASGKVINCHGASLVVEDYRHAIRADLLLAGAVDDEKRVLAPGRCVAHGSTSDDDRPQDGVINLAILLQCLHGVPAHATEAG